MCLPYTKLSLSEFTIRFVTYAEIHISTNIPFANLSQENIKHSLDTSSAVTYDCSFNVCIVRAISCMRRVIPGLSTGTVSGPAQAMWDLWWTSGTNTGFFLLNLLTLPLTFHQIIIMIN